MSSVVSWDEYFILMIDHVKIRSKDQSTQVGCLVVGPNHEIRSTGYNSFPRGINDDAPERQERPLKYSYMEHAERNAIYNCARVGTPTDGCIIYQPWLPCNDCARAIIQAGIKKVIIDGRKYEETKKYWDERWFDSMVVSVTMLREAGVVIEVYTEEGNWELIEYKRSDIW